MVWINRADSIDEDIHVSCIVNIRLQRPGRISAIRETVAVRYGGFDESHRDSDWTFAKSHFVT